MANISEMDIRMASEAGGDAVKPCPFCGSTNIAYGKYEHAAGPRYAILCMNCMAQIDPGWAQSRHAVQDLWNCRANPGAASNTNAVTNANHIRSMTDEELAEMISTDMAEEKNGYCQNKPKCNEEVDDDGVVLTESCKQCALDWLKMPARGKQND